MGTFFPLEVWANITKNADKKTKKNLRNILARKDIQLSVYKDDLGKNADNILRQNITNGYFAENEFDHEDYQKLLDETIRSTLNREYNKNRIQFYLRYALLKYLNQETIDQNELPIKIEYETFKIDNEGEYPITKFIYPKEGEIVYQILYAP